MIVDSAGFAGVTDGGRNSIQRVDPSEEGVTEYPLPGDRPDSNLNTAVFGAEGTLCFTGQIGVVGWLDPGSGEMRAFKAPRGRGPYGITATSDGDVYFASLAGSYVGRLAMMDRSPFWSHQRRTRGREECGPIRRDTFG